MSFADQRWIGLGLLILFAASLLACAVLDKLDELRARRMSGWCCHACEDNIYGGTE